MAGSCRKAASPSPGPLNRSCPATRAARQRNTGHSVHSPPLIMECHLLTLTFPSYTADATHKSVDLQVASRQACRCGRRRPPEEGRQEHPFLPAEEGSVPGGLRRGPRSPQDLHGRTGTRGAQPHPTQPGAHRRADGRRGGGADEVTSKSLQITAPFQIRIQKAVSSLAP